MGFRVTVPATVEPVSITEAKAQCRVDSDVEENVILGYVQAATRHAETFTRRQFINATCELTLPKFMGEMVLPRSPLNSVTSIYYINSDGDSTELPEATYDVDSTEEPGIVRLAYGATWPIARSVYNAVKITFTAGYGTSGSDVPATIRQAILMLSAHFYKFREPVALLDRGMSIHPIPLSVETLLWGERVCL